MQSPERALGGLLFVILTSVKLLGMFLPNVATSSYRFSVTRLAEMALK